MLKLQHTSRKHWKRTIAGFSHWFVILSASKDSFYRWCGSILAIHVCAIFPGFCKVAGTSWPGPNLNFNTTSKISSVLGPWSKTVPRLDKTTTLVQSVQMSQKPIWSNVKSIVRAAFCHRWLNMTSSRFSRRPLLSSMLVKHGEVAWNVNTSLGSCGWRLEDHTTKQCWAFTI